VHGYLRTTPQVQFSVCYPPDLMPGATLTFLGGGGINLTVPWETHLTDPSTAVCLSPSLSTLGAAVNGQDVAFRVSFHETNAGVETAFGTTVEAAGEVPTAVGWVNVLYLDGVPVQSSYMRGPLASGDTLEDTMVWQFGPLGSQPRLLELVRAPPRAQLSSLRAVGCPVQPLCEASSERQGLGSGDLRRHWMRTAR
jgi:hypothetical protein